MVDFQPFYGKDNFMAQILQSLCYKVCYVTNIQHIWTVYSNSGFILHY